MRLYIYPRNITNSTITGGVDNRIIKTNVNAEDYFNQTINILTSSIEFVKWFLGFIFSLGLYWMGHIGLLLMFIEIFIIGLAVVIGRLNPVMVIKNYITLHYQIIYIFFMLCYYIMSLIYNGVIALTTWIP